MRYITGRKAIELTPDHLSKTIDVIRKDCARMLRCLAKMNKDAWKLFFKGSVVRQGIRSDEILSKIPNLDQCISENRDLPASAFHHVESDLDVLMIFKAGDTEKQHYQKIKDMHAKLVEMLPNYKVVMKKGAREDCYHTIRLYITARPHPAFFATNLKPFQIDITVEEKGKKSLFGLFPLTNTCDIITDGKCLKFLHDKWYASKHFGNPCRVSIFSGSSNMNFALEQAVHDAKNGQTRMIMYCFEAYVRRLFDNCFADEKKTRLGDLVMMFFNYVVRQVSRLLKLMRDDINVIGLHPKLDNAKRCFVCPTTRGETKIENIKIGLKFDSPLVENKDKIFTCEDGAEFNLPFDKEEEKEVEISTDDEREDDERDEGLPKQWQNLVDTTSILQPVYYCKGCNEYKELFVNFIQ